MFNKVETEEQAFEIVGFTPDLEKFKASGCYPEDRVQSKFDEFIIELVCEATNKINGNWKPDWNDPNQWKYLTAHRVLKDKSNPAGFGLAASYYGYWNATTNVGERLLVGSSEQAIYIGEQFKSKFESARLTVTI